MKDVRVVDQDGNKTDYQTEFVCRITSPGSELAFPHAMGCRAASETAGTGRKRVRCALTGSRNPYRARAFEELAKHYEHRERDLSAALRMARTARAMADTERLRRREQRLTVRLAKMVRP